MGRSSILTSATRISENLTDKYIKLGFDLWFPNHYNIKMKQKTCTKCKFQREIIEFRVRSKASDGLTSWCKNCLKKYEKESYNTGKIDKNKKLLQQKIRADRNKSYIKSYLETHPCIDCGDVDWWNLEFDHKEQYNKISNINRLMYGFSLEKLKNEIAKCEVRCLKCHRKRTIHQLKWWRMVAFKDNK